MKLFSRTFLLDFFVLFVVIIIFQSCACWTVDCGCSFDCQGGDCICDNNCKNHIRRRLLSNTWLISAYDEDDFCSTFEFLNDDKMIWKKIHCLDSITISADTFLFDKEYTAIIKKHGNSLIGINQDPCDVYQFCLDEDFLEIDSRCDTSYKRYSGQVVE